MPALRVQIPEVFFYECVLVLLNDYYDAPFSEIFDATAFMIKWPMTQVDASFIDFLESLPLKDLEALVAEAKKVRCWYMYPPSRVEHSHVNMRKLRPLCPDFEHENAYVAVHRLLARKVRATKPGFGKFYPYGQEAVQLAQG